ncbi:AraC family transcriptional regulator [Pedobacter nutrimenti]|uniref:helix-turn-helix domain-containing protein n=1 Tax=Pedobacter nutrimenti TaxID=1241337 RepID=UPI00292D4F96|nr:AraC family transcriptional regulator [Pedobacter nutrimenti]
MKYIETKSCYIGPEISPEQFISEHFFLFLVKGSITGYDGNKKYELKAGDSCIVKKNRLARYHKQTHDERMEKVVVIFDKAFLKSFQLKHQGTSSVTDNQNAFILLKRDDLINSFINSLTPYYGNNGKMDEVFSNIKREELLLILLQKDPELYNILFDFGIPEKIDLEEFMNRNYKFNVSIERFAYLTGRSLSAFKRDFKTIFQDTPSRWLVKRRLEEAYFLMEKKSKKPSDIYIDLGFEDLSHFSFAFKKKYGLAPSLLSKS